jgi:hypothetical protein
MDYETFIHDNALTADSARSDRNPAMPDARDMDHWRVTIRHGRRRMVVPFSTGRAFEGRPPTLADVLEALASGASGIEHADRSFETWADDYGLDADSRTAERTYRATLAQSRRLHAFLGPQLYDALLEVEA